VDLPAITRYYAGALARGYDHTVHYRKSGKLPPNQVVDLYFRDFIGDQVGTVRRAYQHFGLDLTDNAAKSMEDFLVKNPADKHGKHVYRLADTGLAEGQLRNLFAGYQDYFQVPLETLD
jgi:hypothetical protein